MGDRLVETIKSQYDNNWLKQASKYKHPPKGIKRGYDTGALFNSIERLEPEGDEIIIKTGVPYAKFHERGTSSGLPAVNFMENPLKESKAELKKIAKQKLREVLKNVRF